MATSRRTFALMALGACLLSCSREASMTPNSWSTRVAIISPTAGADSPHEEHDAESLLQADILHVDLREERSKLRPPYPAGWFGGFSEGESTYDLDGTQAHRDVNAQINVLDGWNPQQQNPFVDPAVDHKWFTESKSGGEKQAWQSFYPADQSSMSGNRAETGPWFEGDGGVFQQEYRSASALSDQAPSASWFDNSVNQLDGFGRQKLPSLGSPRNYLDWEERSVNTTLTCKAPGCTANVSLVAPFNFNTEMYKNCRLSVFFHPTDFDAQYSRESVEWVQVNGRKVQTFCRPLTSGCNKTAGQSLLPCVNSVPIDLLLDQTARNGDLKVSAKIPEYVDECPYEGNMLSAVPMVTCLVALKKPVLAVKGAVPKKPVVELVHAGTCVTKMPLQCATKGCASEIAIPVNKSCAALGQCLLSIQVRQTDYDNQDGTSELIEYIKVDGKEVKTKLNPGKNPCKTKWEGKASLTEAEMSFAALSNHVLTVSNGKVIVEGKISKFVDECASNGYLFDATAVVTCSKPGAAKAAKAANQGAAKAAKAAKPALLEDQPSTAHRRKLRVKSEAR